MPRLRKTDPVVWAEANIHLPQLGNARPGRLTLYGWQHEVLRSLVKPGRTVLRCASQMGKSTLYICRLGYAMAAAPSSVVIALPTLDDIQSFHRVKFWPVLEQSPALRSLVRPSAHRRGEKVSAANVVWPGGALRYAHASSGRALRGHTAPVLLFDEVDACEGSMDARNPVDMLAQRGESYAAAQVSLGLSSTPRMGGFIDWYYDAGTQHRWMVRCDACGERFEWPFEPDFAAQGWIPCPGCGQRFGDDAAMAMNAGGEWVAAYPARAYRSYHITQLASPIRRHSETLAEYNPAAPSGFYTQKLASSYGDVLGSLAIDDEELVWSEQMPWAGEAAAMGVDVQGDRIECQLVQFAGHETQAWTYDHRVLHFADAGADAAWDRLASGFAQSGAAICFVDTGYEPDQVRTQCRRVFGTRWGRSVFGCHSGKNSDTLDNPAGLILANASSGDVRICTQQAKQALAHMIANGRYKARPSGVFRAPGSRMDFLTQLQSESLVLSPRDATKRAWQTLGSGVRNEALDCFVYAMCAAAYLRTPHYRRRKAQRRP